MERKMLFPLTALIVLLGLVTLTSAQEKKATLTGYLVDKMCAQGQAKKDNPGAEHSRKCALMANCEASGFGIFADGKFYEFDKKGIELAKEFLKNTTKEKGLKVTVEGQVHEDHLMVDSLKEAAE